MKDEYFETILEEAEKKYVSSRPSFPNFLENNKPSNVHELIENKLILSKNGM